MAVTFDPAYFRDKFPQFSDNPPWTDAVLTGYFDTAGLYVKGDGYPCVISSDAAAWGLYLMTAHLAALSVMVANGETPGLVSQSQIDKISVTLTMPPLPNQWQWWLNLTPYGQQLLALYQVKSAGGFYVGGLPETAAFRRVGGYVR